MKALHGAWRDLAIVAVNVAVNESERRARRYRDRFALPFPVIYDEGHAITGAYGVRGTPTHVIIDRDGLIRYFRISPPENLDSLLGPAGPAERSGDHRGRLRK